MNIYQRYAVFEIQLCFNRIDVIRASPFDNFDEAAKKLQSVTSPYQGIVIDYGNPREDGSYSEFGRICKINT